MITYVNFLSKFKMVLNKGSSTEAAALRLLNFKQAKRSMSDYSIDFWILAEVTGWGPEAFRSALLFPKELNDELIMRDVPASFDELMSLCFKVDGWTTAPTRPWGNSVRAHRLNMDPFGHQRALTGGNQCRLAAHILQPRSASIASQPGSCVKGHAHQ